MVRYFFFFSWILSLVLTLNSEGLDKPSVYQHIAQELKAVNATHLKECNCMKAYYRNLFAPPTDTARYSFDAKVTEYALKSAQDARPVSIFAIGSGTLLNELTAFASILAQGKSLKIYISDWAYIFYGKEHYEEQAIMYARDRSRLPLAWRDFYFWNWEEKRNQDFLKLFSDHHAAIDEFKQVIAALDLIYNTQSTVELIEPFSEKKIILPPLDLIITVDAFLDLPNVMWNLFYRMQLAGPVVYVSLNKTKPSGGFWEPEDDKHIEANSLNSVSLEVYQITSSPIGGSYKILEKSEFKPSLEQLKASPDFRKGPDVDPVQSPFEINTLKSSPHESH